MSDDAKRQEWYEESVATFSTVAPVYYERMGDYFRDPSFTDHYMLTKLMTFLPGKGAILDVGCGPGGASDRFAKEGFSVTGIDMAENMIEVAKKAVPQAHFQVMDMGKTTFPDQSFDCVAALYSLYQLLDEETIEGALTEFSRLLKRDGILCLALKDIFGGDRNVKKDWIHPETSESLGRVYYNFIERDYIIPKLQLMGYTMLYEAMWTEPKLDKNSNHRFYILQKRY